MLKLVVNLFKLLSLTLASCQLSSVVVKPRQLPLAAWNTRWASSALSGSRLLSTFVNVKCRLHLSIFVNFHLIREFSPTLMNCRLTFVNTRQPSPTVVTFFALVRLYLITRLKIVNACIPWPKLLSS